MTDSHTHPRNLAKTIGRNTVVGMAANVVQVGTRLITVPIIIHHVGLSGYGIWNIITIASMYMRFGSIGIKSAFQKYVAEASIKQEYGEVNRLLSTGSAVMFLLSLAGLLPVCFYSQNLAAMVGVPSQFLHSAGGAFAFLALVMLLANSSAGYEAICLGQQRIDLIRQFNMVLSVAEAIAIVIVLKLGYGLFAMAAVMGASEMVFVILCFAASKRIGPKFKIHPRFVTPTVLYELLRFGGSYQLVNILDIIYGAILPLAVLRVFGAEMVGIQGVISRVVSSVGMLQDSFLSPILSGGTAVFASGNKEHMRELVKKAFKVTLSLSLLPLGFISCFGSTLAFAWAGEKNGAFALAFVIACSTRFFTSLSQLALVLYRVSGHAILDNLRQVLRILCMLGVAAFARKLGFFGSMAGLTVTEFIGMAFMIYSLTRTFHLFTAKSLLPDTIRLTFASALVTGAALAASYIPIPWPGSERMAAAFTILLCCTVSALALWPAMKLTGALTTSEGDAILGSFLPARSLQ